MSANPYPQQPAQPWMALPVPGAPDVETLARAISPEENQARGRAAYLRALMHTMVPMLAIGGLVAVLLGASLLTMGRVPWWAGAVGIGGFWVLVCGLGVAIGLPLGLAVNRSRAEDELGVGRVLTTAWNQLGFTIAGLRGMRSIPFSDVRAVRRGGAGQRDHEAGVVLELTVGVVDGTAQGPYPRILDTGCDYAAVGSVAVLPVS